MVTICTTSLTFNNSTFCPHSIFLCFVWIWEQTAIISLYSINWLVFITKKECVYRAVRTGYLTVIRLIFVVKIYQVLIFVKKKPFFSAHSSDCTSKVTVYTEGKLYQTTLLWLSIQICWNDRLLTDMMLETIFFPYIHIDYFFQRTHKIWVSCDVLGTATFVSCTCRTVFVFQFGFAREWKLIVGSSNSWDCRGQFNRVQ